MNDGPGPIGCLIGVAVFYLASAAVGWVILQISPALYNTLPSILSQDASMTVDVKNHSDGKFTIESSCHHVPFLMIPISGLPSTVTVVFTDGGTELGESTYSCRTGKELGTKQY